MFGVITNIITVVTHCILTKCHGAESSCGVSKEAQTIKLVLDLDVARRRSVVRVIVEVTKGGEEDTLFELGLVNLSASC